MEQYWNNNNFNFQHGVSLHFQEFINKQDLDKDGDKRVTFEEFKEAFGKADVSNPILKLVCNREIWLKSLPLNVVTLS